MNLVKPMSLQIQEPRQVRGRPSQSPNELDQARGRLLSRDSVVLKYHASRLTS